MSDAYDIIKKARILLAAIPDTKLKASTKTDYVAKVKRLQSKAGANSLPLAWVAAAADTTKKSTWQANRAALIYCFTRLLSHYLKQQDTLQRSMKALKILGGTSDQSEWIGKVEQIKALSEGLQRVLDAKLPIEGREDRHTKRQDMRGLPKNWRERIITRMPKYADQALAAAVTGCRPAELVNGIELSIDAQNGDLVAQIKGAKTSEKTGQEWRQMRWPSSSDSGLVRNLTELVGRHPAGSVVRIAVDDARTFSGAMRAAGKREWPKRQTTVTPYCMRHQAAADMKASESMSSGDISAALGHVSDVTKSTYGHANMGRKSGGVAPTRVEAARPVLTKTPSPAARQVTKQVTKAGQEVSKPRPRPSPS